MGKQRRLQNPSQKHQRKGGRIDEGDLFHTCITCQPGNRSQHPSMATNNVRLARTTRKKKNRGENLMPRCRKCGTEVRSCKSLEQHWRENHSQEYQKRLSDKKQNSRKLQLTNLIEYWKRKNQRKTDAPGHADQRQAQGQTTSLNAR